ncbi:hypothetical protein HK101_009821 [Irineochytrium annulatum]|nr:hypothetical protein HK101_009821 [Irineochytrium annulatum]
MSSSALPPATPSTPSTPTAAASLDIPTLALYAQKGHLPSIVRLCQLLDDQTATNPKAAAESCRWVLAACHLDHSESQIEYARRLIAGDRGVPKDDYEAFGWYVFTVVLMSLMVIPNRLVSAARTADAPMLHQCTRLVSALLLTSPLAPADVLPPLMDVLARNASDALFPFGERASVEAWERHALWGSSHAAHELGSVYASGEGGVAESAAAAAWWYVESARRGSWKGVLAVGNAMADGRLAEGGIPADQGMAGKLKEIAAGMRTHPGREWVMPEGWDRAIRVRAKPAELVSRRALGVEGGIAWDEAMAAVDAFLAGGEGRKVAKGRLVELAKRRRVNGVRAKAKSGDVDAMVELAGMEGTGEEEKKALLEKAIRMGSVAAIYAKYKMLAAKDNEATEWLNKAVEQKWPQACFEQGQQYEKGTFWVDKNPDKAIEMYKLAGSWLVLTAGIQDHGDSLYRVSVILASSNKTESVSYLKRAAAAGHLAAACDYGIHLIEIESPSGGSWVERAVDRVKTLDPNSPSAPDATRIKRTVDQMRSECQTFLESAGKRLILAARSGDATSQMKLAYILKGLGYSGIAMTLFLANLSDATTGATNADAQYEVGRAFHHGLGDIHRNLLRAAGHYHSAASCPREPATTLSGAAGCTSAQLALLALADLFEQGSEDVDGSPSAQAFPTDRALAGLYRRLAAESVASGSMPGPGKVGALPESVPFDVVGFMEGEARDRTIRHQAMLGVLHVGEVEELMGGGTLARGAGGRKTDGGAIREEKDVAGGVEHSVSAATPAMEQQYQQYGDEPPMAPAKRKGDKSEVGGAGCCVIL